MKYIFVSLFLLCVVSVSRADEIQSLLIPKIDNAVKARNGSIELPAFCSDISRTWASDGVAFSTIYWGGAETFLNLSVNGKFTRMALNSCLVKYHYVKIIAGTRSVFIKSINNIVRLLSIESNGFLIGGKNSLPLITRDDFLNSISSFNDANYNIDALNYYRYQQQWWKVIHALEKKNMAVITQRTTEIAKKYFTNKEIEITILPSGQIKLYDKGRNLKLIERFYSDQVVEAANLRRLAIDEPEEWEICLNFDPGDSNVLSLTIAGKYNNIVPIELEYTAKNEIKVTTSINKELQLAPGINIEGEIAIEVEPKEGTASLNYPFKKCELKASGSICYPKGIKIEVEICGTRLNMDLKGVSFNSYF